MTKATLGQAAITHTCPNHHSRPGGQGNGFNGLTAQQFAAKGKGGTCPAHMHGGGKPGKGGTEGIQLTIGRLQNMIGKLSAQVGHDCGGGNGGGKHQAIEQEFVKTLKALSASISGQAKGGGACSAAGQMDQLVNKLDSTLQTGVKPDLRHSPSHPDQPHVKQILAEIGALLKRLSASLHSSLPMKPGL